MRAFHEMCIRDRTDEALKLLNDDYSKNATLLKAEIFWNARQWGDAADAIKYLIEKPTPGKPVSQEQINYILDWATTLKKAGRETVLVRLRNKFMPYFERCGPIQNIVDLFLRQRFARGRFFYRCV